MQFETCPSFRNSLIRFNTANRARRTGRAIILGQAIHDSLAFEYSADIPGASTSCTIDINFDADDKIPGRIACLIGRNAVGKTQVLASLAMDLTQIAQRSREELEKRDDRFSGRRPVAATAFLDSLSSGEAILTHLTTALVSWLEPFSLVLFDEPETHLHPNAVANLFSVLSELLLQNESFALIATHSPIVLQEIPRSRVVLLTRDGDVTTSAKLDTESFGESLSELTRHVFETNEVKNPYKVTSQNWLMRNLSIKR